MASGSDARAAQFLAEGAALVPPESVENTARRTVRVLLPLPLADAYDYSVPEGLGVAPGQFVMVPLGKRETLGVVWGEGTGEVPAAKLRDVIEVLPALPMADTLRRFAASVGHAGKYSDRITAFWMYQMAAAHAVMPTAAFDDVVRAFPRLLDKELLAVTPRAADSSGDPSDRVVSRGPA